MSTLISDTPEWKSLQEHAKSSFTLRDLMKDPARCEAMLHNFGKTYLDFSRELMTQETLCLLSALAEKADVFGKISSMLKGERINSTEDRAVRHVDLRASPAPPEVEHVRNQIKNFSTAVRDGTLRGAHGELLTDVVCIGIGGSYLGAEFVYEALRTKPINQQPSHQRRLRFLANVDPIDVARALEGLNPKSTLVVVVSKTFTTAETMLNARTVRDWLVKGVGETSVAKHMVAVSTALDKTRAFGIPDENVFGFWEWVGGRFSVSSAVGLLPLSLQFGYDVCEEFLRGARDMDIHFSNAGRDDVWNNLPVALALISVWNHSFLGFASCAVLPYCQALNRFVPYLQQVDMESNGKRVSISGQNIPFDTAPATFGEPGTNGQHSFYQLLHQGTRIIPAEFIGFVKSDFDIHNDKVSNHDELMSNFFAQPDALALGLDNFDNLHKHFPGNRPSLSLLLPKCDPYHVGQLLALYEHKTAVQSFIWGTNAFDQWGVELGKILAKEVRGYLSSGQNIDKFAISTQKLLEIYKQ